MGLPKYLFVRGKKPISPVVLQGLEFQLPQAFQRSLRWFLKVFSRKVGNLASGQCLHFPVKKLKPRDLMPLSWVTSNQ